MKRKNVVKDDGHYEKNGKQNSYSFQWSKIWEQTKRFRQQDEITIRTERELTTKFEWMNYKSFIEHIV